jgi:hypothetical protein
MDEKKWQACSDIRVLAQCRTVGIRQLRLFLCARARRFWDVLRDGRAQVIVEAAERQAYGQATVDHVRARLRSGRPLRGMLEVYRDERLDWLGLPDFLAYTLRWLARPDLRRLPYHVLRPRGLSWDAEAHEHEVRVFRDIAGNPFRRTRMDPAWLAWGSGTVLRLALRIHEERAFDCLPILADALEDAGCADEEILSHCRGPSPHVRGCWVIDGLLEQHLGLCGAGRRVRRGRCQEERQREGGPARP